MFNFIQESKRTPALRRPSTIFWLLACLGLSRAQTSREPWRKDQGRQNEPTLVEKGDDETHVDHDKSHDKNHEEIDTTNRARIRGRNVMPCSPCVLSWFNSDPL